MAQVVPARERCVAVGCANSGVGESREGIQVCAHRDGYRMLQKAAARFYHHEQWTARLFLSLSEGMVFFRCGITVLNNEVHTTP